MPGATALGVATPTRQRQRHATHRHIFEVALDEIATHGIAGTSVAAIAQRSGVSRQTVYDHFPTLVDVVAEVFADYRVAVAERLVEQIDTSTPLAEVLAALVDALFEASAPTESLLRQEVGAYLVRGVEVAGWIEEPLYQAVAAAVAREQREGRVRGDVGPSDLTRLLLTCLGGFLLIESESPASRAQRAHLAIEMLLEGARP